MVRRLTRHGDDLALVIERPILELLGIDVDTPLEISTDGRVLIVSPMPNEEHRGRLEAALSKVNRKYGRALARLAR